METKNLPESPFAEEVEELPPEEIDTEDSPFHTKIVIEDEAPEEEPEDEAELEAEPEGDEDAEDFTDEEVESLLEELESLESDDSEETVEEPQEDSKSEVDTVPHAALHKERERRKEVQAVLAQTQNLVNEQANMAKQYKDAFDDLESQLEELGVKDMVTVKKPESMSPEVMQLRAQQEEQQEMAQFANTVQQVRSEALGHIDEFSAISKDDPEQGELLVGYAISAMMLGADMEEAVLKGMGILNKHLIAERKHATRKTVKRTPAAPRTPRKRQASSVSKAMKDGNMRGVFDGIADSFMQTE